MTRQILEPAKDRVHQRPTGATNATCHSHPKPDIAGLRQEFDQVRVVSAAPEHVRLSVLGGGAIPSRERRLVEPSRSIDHVVVQRWRRKGPFIEQPKQGAVRRAGFSKGHV